MPPLASKDEEKPASTSAASMPPPPQPQQPLQACALKVNVKSVDMPEEMQKRATALAQDALSKHTVLREIAGAVKKEFDKDYGSTWHCVVGKSFGSYVTHQSNSFIFFYVGDHAFMLFKTA